MGRRWSTNHADEIGVCETRAVSCGVDRAEGVEGKATEGRCLCDSVFLEEYRQCYPIGIGVFHFRIMLYNRSTLLCSVKVESWTPWPVTPTRPANMLFWRRAF